MKKARPKTREEVMNELYWCAALLLAAAKATRKSVKGPWPTMDKLIRRAEAALKARPQ